MDLLERLREADYLRPLKRFPIASAISAIITLLFLALTWGGENMSSGTVTLIFRIVFALSIAFMVVGAVQLYADKNKLIPPVRVIAIVVAMLITLIMTFLAFPDFTVSPVSLTNIFQMWVITGFALVLPMSSAYLSDPDNNAYWKFNSLISRRTALTILFTSILVVGLFLALGAIGLLLGAEVDGRLFPTIAILGYTLAVPYISLMLVPEKFDLSVTDKDYPQSTLRLTQLVLIPLLTIYTVILYLYIMKSAVSGDVPSNQFVPLTLVFLLPGFISVTGLFPLINSEKHKWVRKFIRVFSIAMQPLMLAYFYGIFVRISEYGLTILRFYVVLTGLYIVGAAIYLLFIKKPRLSYLILGLPLIIFIFTFFPFLNVFTISSSRQYSILSSQLANIGAIENGVLTGQEVSIDREEYNSLRSRVGYILSAFGTGGMEQWIGADRLSELGILRNNQSSFLGYSGNSAADMVLSELGVSTDYIEARTPFGSNKPSVVNFTFSSNKSDSGSGSGRVSGFDWVKEFNLNSNYNTSETFARDESMAVSTNVISIVESNLLISVRGQIEIVNLKELSSNNLSEEFERNYVYETLGAEDLSFEGNNYEVDIRRVEGTFNKDTGELKITGVSGVVKTRD